MAEQTDIDFLMMLVGTELIEEGQFGTILDAQDGNVTLAAAQVWEIRAGKYSTLVDISESGSSRSMGKMYENALKMAEYYRKKAGDEIADPDDPEPVVGVTRTRPIVRP
jgi:hypothetical protein